MTLNTTIELLMQHRACSDRFAHLLFSLGLAPDADPAQLSDVLAALTPEQRAAPINLLRILETNGLDDCVWAFCATIEDAAAPARAEYERAIVSAQAELAIASAWAEFVRATASARAWAEYERARASVLERILRKVLG